MLFRSDTHIDLQQPGPSPGHKVTWSQVCAALSVSIGSMIVGFSSGYTSPALVSMKEDTETFGSITASEESWIASLLPLCALCGGLLGGTIIEGIGRKWTMLGTAIPFLIGGLLITFAQNVYMVYAGRGIIGCCIGIVSLTMPVYLGETIQPQVRGTLGLLPTTIGNTGILLCFVVGSFLDWSMLALIGACISVPFFISMLLIPETPRWYIAKGKKKEAKAALQWLRGKDVDITTELSEIENMHILSGKNAARLRDMIKMTYLKPLLISLGLMLFQQLSGINAVLFYAKQIFQNANTGINENLCTMVVALVNFGATFLSNVLIDRLGRKILLFISNIFMMFCLVILGVYFHLEVAKREDITWLPLASVVVYVISFSLGFGPIPWLLLGEIFPGKVRGVAASISTTFNWTCAFIVTKTFKDLLIELGEDGTFWLFAAITGLGFFFIFFFVPETQGKSLEDIEASLTGQTHRVPSSANLKPTPSFLL